MSEAEIQRMERSKYWTRAEFSAWANRDAKARARQAAEIKRLKSILDDPGPTGRLTGRRLKAEAEYIASRVVQVLRTFWRGWSGPTAPAN